MKQVRKILVPTDLSDQSRRGFCYACSLATEEKADLIVLHVANEFKAWELFSDDFGFLDPALRACLLTECSPRQVSISTDSWSRTSI